MKQDPILPSIHVCGMQTPPKRMLPVLEKIGSADYMIGEGLIALLLHGLCVLVALWCMDIPKHDHPLHSTIEVAFETPTAFPIPEDVHELPDTTNNDLQSVFIESPLPLEPLPQSDSIAYLPVVKARHSIKDQKSLYSHSSIDADKGEVAHSASSQTGQQISSQLNNTVHSTKPAIKTFSAAQRCSVVSNDYPIAARRRHEEGTVRVGYQLLSDGQIQHVEVIETSGFSALDQAAINAVKMIKCQPAPGQPIIKASLPVHFSLNKK